MKNIPRIGISGWRTSRGARTFYPEDLPQKKELYYASRQLNSIEINGSFYSLQRPSSWKSWYQETPADFLFSIKGGRYITHMLKLNNVENAMANFFAQGLLALEEKIGPILWQFPPNFAFSGEKIEKFFKILPKDTKSAAVLAKKHTPLLKGRSFFKPKDNHPLRHAMEIRHESFRSPDFIALLRKHNIALVIADTAGKWPFLEDITSDFIYARLHGDEQLYTSGYTPESLDNWAARIKAWQMGSEIATAIHVSPKAAKKRKSRPIHIYFDNDVKVRAPFDAFALAQRTGGFIPENPPLNPPKNLPHEAREHWPVVR